MFPLEGKEYLLNVFEKRRKIYLRLVKVLVTPRIEMKPSENVLPVKNKIVYSRSRLASMVHWKS